MKEKEYNRSKAPSPNTHSEEPFVPYVTDNYYNLIQLSRNGVLKNALMKLAERLAFTAAELSGILHISERTLQRYHNDDKLASDTSERALLLARLYKKGIDVFQTPENFKSWLRVPLPVFNGQPPVHLLDTSFGFQLIDDELGRIEHGIFA